MARFFDFASNCSGGTDIVLNQITLQCNTRSSCHADDTAQLLDVALSGTNGLNSPDKRGDLDGELTDQIQRRQCILLSCGTDDVFDQGRVVARSLQTGGGGIKGCTEEVELGELGQSTDSLDCKKFRG